MKKKILKNIEWGILVCAIVLCIIGLVALFSATQNSDYDEFKKRNLFILLSKKGLKKEQLKFVEEHSLKGKKIIFRLESENIISKKEAIKYLRVSTNRLYF